MIKALSKKIPLLALIFLLFSKIMAQPIGIDLLNGQKDIEIPFSMQQGLMIVDIKLKNVLPLKFIFDTGAENTILFHREYSDILGLEYTSRVQVVGSDLSEELHALISRNVNIALPDITSVTRDLLILEEDVYLLQEKLGFNVDGILGGSFFKSMVIQINYKKGIIEVIHPEQFSPKSDFEEFDIDIKSNKPYLNGIVEVEEGRKVNAKFLLDTGAALPFLLHNNTDTLIEMPANVINGNIGHGMGGALLGYSGKINRLSLGSFSFENIITSFQDVSEHIKVLHAKELLRNGLIGNNLLSRFEIYIDYLRNKLYLKPRKNYNKEFEYDKSGLTIYAFGLGLKQFIIKSIIANSPADRAGFQSGDIIVKICRKKAQRWNLEKINKLLQKEIGTLIKMEVERDGKIIPIEFMLEDLFKEKKNLGL